MIKLAPAHPKLAGVSILLLVFTISGHFYRMPFQKQFVNWHDGVKGYSYGKDYPDTRNAFDSYDENYYKNLKSKADIVTYMNTFNPPGEEAKMRTMHLIVSKRFIHYMYPTYNWLQNPLFNILEVIAPHKSFNQIYTANDLLRHSAASACGHVSTVFIESFRHVGGKAQFVSLGGEHSIAEAVVDGKRFIVDCDFELVIPYSVQELSKTPELAYKFYSAKGGGKLGLEIKEIFETQTPIEFGYDGLPTSSPKTYSMHALYSKVKFCIPILLLIFSWINFKIKKAHC